MSQVSWTDEAVNAKVITLIAESLCVDESLVSMNANLMSDLGAESIDFLDIVFKLEQEFGIKIPQKEFENLARGGLEPHEFEVDGVIQPKGIERLRMMLPEISPEKFREGMSIRELPGLFTVNVFASIVNRKIKGEFPVFAQSDAGTSLNIPSS